ncbi:hypothetical protein J6590_048781 [Homalodisca vitripennis]|nr:hypothetical protein J6590_048781 [Homalodisca vitripennis]
MEVTAYACEPPERVIGTCFQLWILPPPLVGSGGYCTRAASTVNVNDDPFMVPTERPFPVRVSSGRYRDFYSLKVHNKSVCGFNHFLFGKRFSRLRIGQDSGSRKKEELA